jgi:protein gp37
MHPDWARSLRDQCVEAGVPFLFKQAGTRLAKQWGCTDRKGANLDEIPGDLRIREFPHV